MNDLLRDIRIGVRSSIRSPGFTAMAVLTLALGIGTNAAIFSVVDAVLFRAYPYQDPEELVMLRTENTRRGSGDDARVSPPDLADVRARVPALEDAAGVLFTDLNLAGGGEPVRVRGALVTGNVFEVVGTRAVIGRVFTPADQGPGKPDVVILSDSLWQRSFGGDRGLVGRTIRVDGVAHTVVGIVPAATQWPDTNDAEAFVPLESELADADRGARGMVAMARLAGGVGLERARSELRALSVQLAAEHPETNADWQLAAHSLREFRTRDDRPLMLLALGAVGFVLLIACVNVANLLLQRYLARQREFSLRAALGASRRRLLGALIGEGLPLAAAGALLGLAVAAGLLRLIVASLPPENLPTYQGDFAINARVAGYIVAVSLLTVFLFSLAPALRLLRPGLGRSLTGSGVRASAGQGRMWLRKWLVVAEIALSLVLLASAGLMIRSFRQLLTVDPGFEPVGLLTVEIALPESGYSEPGAMAAFYGELLRRLDGMAGVERVGAGTSPPFGPWPASAPVLEGQSPDEAAANPFVGVQSVDGDYFETIGLGAERGRLFGAADREGPPSVVIVNRELAARLWPDADPIGRRLQLGITEDAWLTVVGVVGGTRRRGLGQPPPFDAYLPWRQHPWSDLDVVARAAGDAAGLFAPVRAEVEALDPALPVRVRRMREILDDSLSVQKISSLLFGLFGLLALALAAIGLYGVMAYAVTQRRQEIGIRMALGSTPKRVLRLVLGQTFRLTLAGVAVGLVGTLALSRALSHLLFEVSGHDPLTIAGVTVVMIAVAAAASAMPAIRATAVDPAVTLRHE